MDLAISLVKVGTIEGAAGRRHFERALGILEGLKREGRLAPEHEPKIESLKKMLG